MWRTLPEPSSNLSSKSDVVRVLLNHGASVNTRSGAGLTSIHEALMKHSVPLLHLLCSCKPDFSLGFSDGVSLLQFCVASREIESLGCLSVLLQYGTNLNETSSFISLLALAVKDIISLPPVVRARSEEILSQPSSSEQPANRFSQRRNSMMMLGVTASKVYAQSPPCQHPGRCIEIMQRCKKIYLLLSFGADPHAISLGDDSPASALHKFVRHSIDSELRDRSETSVDSQCDLVLKRLAYEDIYDPSATINKRVQLDLTGEFEWDDSISLLQDAQRTSRRPSTYLQVPVSKRYARASETAMAKMATDIAEFRRPSELSPVASSPNANKKVRSYDRMRRALLRGTGRRFVGAEPVHEFRETPSERAEPIFSHRARDRDGEVPRPRARDLG